MTDTKSEQTSSRVGNAELGQATLQRVLFAPPRPIVSSDLYARVSRGQAARERGALTIAPYTRVTTNTYFGRLPAAHLRHFTNIENIELHVSLSGSGTVSLRDSDDNGKPRIMDSATISGAESQTVVLRGSLHRHLDDGYVWAEFETGIDGLVITDARYVTPDQGRDRKARVAICTFNRAADCLETLRALATDTEALERLEVVYVTDQGTDRVADQPDFAAVEEALGGRLRYINQPNLGGAGGFARGLYESTEIDGSDADVILMDDDIVLEPDTVIRLTAAASRSVRPTIVGGQMLNLYQPTVLHTHAETVDLANLMAGAPVVPRYQSVDLLKRIPSRWAVPGYNAWWCCLIPAEIIKHIGYPLPVFFQWDDVEYGVRASRAGFTTVTLPGAAVWHADFSLKDWDDWSRFYSHRNSLVVSALHADVPPSRMVGTMAKAYLRYIMGMQYGMAATLSLALTSYLRGPDDLADGGASSLKRVRELRAKYPDTVPQSPSGMAAEGPLPPLHDVERSGTPSRVKLVLLKRLVYRALGRSNGVATLPAAAGAWWNASIYKRVVVTDASQNAFRVRSYDKEVAVRETRKAAVLLRRLLVDGAKVRGRWRDAAPKLTSAANWGRIYEGVE